MWNEGISLIACISLCWGFEVSGEILEFGLLNVDYECWVVTNNFVKFGGELIRKEQINQPTR